jgi:PhoPQ-activated pathogenicity-related protein
LIAETFVRYLKTQDENWPLLLPMVKSVVKGWMFSRPSGKKDWHRSIEKFIVAGASSAAGRPGSQLPVDKRVSAIAPVVIDVLEYARANVASAQAFGAYSSRLAAYSSRGLLPIPETPAGERLLRMVDPWAYRDRLTMPKLIVNGTNDFYWTTDALNLYWQGIPDKKWVLYVPNAGHNLRRQDRNPREQLDDLATSLAAFSRYQSTSTPLPSLRWRHENVDGKFRLTVDASPSPVAARLWVAHSETADFRTAQWHAQEMQIRTERLMGDVAAPQTGPGGIFRELDYEIDGLRYHLSTQMRLTP